MNRNALKLLERFLSDPVAFDVKVINLPNGVTIVDAGVNAKGGIEAGRLITEICMGGLGEARLTEFKREDLIMPAIEVSTDSPAISTMGSQYASWKIKVGDFFAMGSGPARALARTPQELYEKINYADEFDKGVIVLETSQIPSEEVCEEIAKKCKINPDGLYVLVTPTASQAGLTQIVGRIVETGVHKMYHSGFDVNKLERGSGMAPIVPVVGDDLRCMGVGNDAIIYCGSVSYVLTSDKDDEIKDLAEKLPSSTSRDYGKPFYDTFKGAGFDFYKIDPGVFAPAEIEIRDKRTGQVWKSGSINVEVLKKSIG